MKITNTPLDRAVGAAPHLDNPVARVYSASGNLPGSSSQVALSAAGQKMLALDGEGDIDMERVQSIRDAIAAGAYKIDAHRIADGLISSARELLR
jgi:negative regulator of flagellin synthesis FlgM